MPPKTLKILLLVILSAGMIPGMGFVGAGSASASESICYACHYGDFLDKGGDCSLWMDHGHPVYVKPSDKIVIPKDFPLDERGNMYCGTCHSVAVRSPDVIKDPWSYSGKFRLKANNSDSYMCKLCHVKMLRRGKQKIRNHPVGVVVDRPSKVLIEAGGKFGTSDKLVICETCHAVHGSRGKKLLAMKNGRGELCSQCHAKTNAFNLEQARGKHIHPVNILPEKALISDRLLSLGTGSGPEGRITCNTCHRLHDPPVRKSLLLISNDNSSLCTECHTGKLKNISGTSHDFNVSAPQAKNANQLTVKETGVCGVCHLTHKRKTAKITGERFAEGVRDRISRLCLSCHQKGGMAESKLLGEFSHPVGMYGKKGKNGRLPLYSREGDPVTDGLVTCATCHDPHRETPEGKKSKVPDQNYFLRISNGKSDLCKQCHSRKRTIIGTPHDLAAGLKEKERIPRLAAGLKEQTGVCSGCHTSHNASTVKLWNRELPDDEETGDTISRICLSCHRDNMIARKHQIGEYSHPMGVEPDLSVTVRDIGLPLFDDRYRPGKTGKVYCSTCHDIHQWAPGQKKPLVKSPGEGDKNNSFLRVAVNDSSGYLCGRCHPDQNRSVSGTGHDLRVSAPGETNLNGLTAEESGVCGSCHQVHKGNGVQIWAKRLERKDDVISDLCSSCHQSGKIAGKKTVGEFSHPVGVPNYAGQEKVGLPMYSKDGRKVEKGGLLTCLTCHLAHPGKSEDKLGGNFLRAAYSKRKVTLCSICHREERWITGTDHDLKITAPTARNAKEKIPEDTPLCQVCHAVHRAETAFRLWNRPLGEGGDKISRLCSGCHSPGKNAGSKTLTGHTHLQGVNLLETGRELKSFNLQLPIYGSNYQPVKFPLEEEGEQPAGGRVYCSSCHQVHKWRADREAFGSGRNEEGDNSSSFLRKSNYPEPELCRECHPDQAMITGSSHDLSVSFPAYRNYRGRSASESGVCGSCHQTHNTESGKRFWAENSGDGKEDVISRYCKSCHQEEGAAQRLVINKNSHPIGLLVPKHLNNKLPLYFKNGQRNDKKGRITCYTCHDIHRQFTKPNKKKEAGQNFDFLRTAKQGSPELCENCHPVEAKVVDTPHDLTSRPGWRNTLVCYACHRMHNAKIRKNLWNGKLGPRVLPGWTESFAGGKALDVQRCTGCHSPGASASGSLPKYGLHKPGLAFIQKIVDKIPSDFSYPIFVYKDRDKRLTLTSTAIIKGVPGYYPLYGQDGNYSLKGDVSCSTCHDVHVWSGKPLLNRNSDYRNNFLRKSIAEYFCADCHGISGLSMMSYFHTLNRTIHSAEDIIKKPKLDSKIKKAAVKFAAKVRNTASVTADKIKNIAAKLAGKNSRKPKPYVLKEGERLKKSVLTRVSEKIKKVSKKMMGKLKKIKNKLTDKKRESEETKKDDQNQAYKNSRADTAERPQSLHWKGQKISDDCEVCHNQSAGFKDKHPLSLFLPGSEKYKSTAAGSGNTKKTTCLFCHDLLIAAENKSNNHEINPYFLKKYRIEYDFKKHKSDKSINFSMIPNTNFIVNITSGKSLEDINGTDKHAKIGVDQRQAESKKKSIYNICYQCHVVSRFLQFNPHINQQAINGELNVEMCLYCHYKIPSPKAGKSKYFYLKHPLAKLCLGCHPQKEKLHPGKVTHLGKRISGEYISQLQSYKAGLPNRSFFPMEDGLTIVCSTCHNPHQWGATELPKTKVGSNKQFRLRTEKPSICPVCHPEKLRKDMDDDRYFW